MDVVVTIVVAVVGSLVLGGVILGALLAASRAKRRELTQRFEQEGIVARSGNGWITLKASSYRGPNLRTSGMIKKNPGELLLTERGLHAVGVSLGPGFGSVDLSLEDLRKWRAWVAGDQIHIATSSPPGATGDVELRMRTPESARLLELLLARGVAAP